MAVRGAWVPADGGYDLVRDSVRVGLVRRRGDGWEGWVEHRGLVVSVGVYAGEVGYAQRAVERRLWG